MTRRPKQGKRSGKLAPPAEEADPLPNAAELRALAAQVKALSGKPQAGLSHADVLNLAKSAGIANMDLVVDLLAEEELGVPMVVLRKASPGRKMLKERLSKREWEVAMLLAEGLSNRDIAARLFVSVATVKDHVHAILRKAQLPNRSAVAATMAQGLGLMYSRPSMGR